MNAFKTILLLVTLILIGGLGALYWADGVDDQIAIVTEPIVEIIEETIMPDPEVHLIFETRVVSDEGEEDWANDDENTYTFYQLELEDIGEEDPEAFASIIHPSEIPGALTSYVFGQDILMHRYQVDNQDAIMDLGGEILETSDEEWDRFRSENNRYQVEYLSAFSLKDEENDTFEITVRDRETDEVTEASYTFDMPENTPGWPEPYEISNDGTRILVRQICDCDFFGPSPKWEVNLATDEVVALHTLYEPAEWLEMSIDLENQRLLVLRSNSEPDENDFGPLGRPVPPTTLEVLTFDGESIAQIEYNESASRLPHISTSGDDQLIVSSADGYDQTLVSFESDPAEETILGTGYVRDWVGDWVVLQDLASNQYTLVNTQTAEAHLILLGEGYGRYIGSITIE